jgi:hypothetical protein
MPKDYGDLRHNTTGTKRCYHSNRLRTATQAKLKSPASRDFSLQLLKNEISALLLGTQESMMVTPAQAD